MRKSNQDRESRKNGNYLLLKITSPDGKNILEEDGCKNLLDDLSSYITNRGGRFYKEGCIVFLESRRLRLVPRIWLKNTRVISIPRKLIKSGRINPNFTYDVVIFDNKNQQHQINYF